jgi:hypothetical protein
LSRWEPRVEVRHVEIVDLDTVDGKVTVEIDIFVKKTHKMISVEATLGGTVADTIFYAAVTQGGQGPYALPE